MGMVAGSLYIHSGARLLTNGFGDMLSFGILPRGVRRRIRFDLAGRLVLGQVRFLFDFALTAAQELRTLLVLKGSADFRFEFLAALMGISEAGFQPSGALFE